uniref:Secreted protein n=1 Tax=Anguilla anguilla TaxID=7936 RepID=A0A0E9P579_ANGAN
MMNFLTLFTQLIFSFFSCIFSMIFCGLETQGYSHCLCGALVLFKQCGCVPTARLLKVNLFMIQRIVFLPLSSMSWNTRGYYVYKYSSIK